MNQHICKVQSWNRKQFSPTRWSLFKVKLPWPNYASLSKRGTGQFFYVTDYRQFNFKLFVWYSCFESTNQFILAHHSSCTTWQKYWLIHTNVRSEHFTELLFLCRANCLRASLDCICNKKSNVNTEQMFIS